MTKQELRNKIRVLKKRQSMQELILQSQQIQSALEAYPDFQRAHIIMIYNSLPDEVQTMFLIEKWRYNKRFILPTVVGDNIVSVELEKDTDFLMGDFHILEPQNKPYNGDFDLIIVPCVACDKRGNRLGRGRGYYDRFLAEHLSVKKVGLYFDFQLVDNVPTESNDIRMDDIITFKRV